MIRLQDVRVVDACRYKVDGKGVTPNYGLGIRVRVSIYMVACYFLVDQYSVTFLVNFSASSPIVFFSLFSLSPPPPINVLFVSQRAGIGNLR